MWPSSGKFKGGLPAAQVDKDNMTLVDLVRAALPTKKLV
jgi:hypothetical protein